jgi:EAL domain-containing protein (putative c-di-GMP-specific phosphodiesterase class I)
MIATKTRNRESKKDSEILHKILEGNNIIPVYQPIVSLKDGQIFGYEALTRISDKTLELNIEEVFILADKMNKLWELETLCRRKALKNAKYMNTEKKLFLNVNPNIIHDAEFRNGFTKSSLIKYGLDSLDIVFEITERNAIIDKDAFLGSIEHYRKQNFKIAIDDVGSGYSGLNAINDIRPDIMKLDMNLTRNIDKDEYKQHLCNAMVNFGKNAGIKVIVEGIESKEELQTLITLEVEFGQGYFLGIPQENFADIPQEKQDLIVKYQR